MRLEFSRHTVAKIFNYLFTLYLVIHSCVWGFIRIVNIIVSNGWRMEYKSNLAFNTAHHNISWIRNYDILIDSD